MARGPIWLFWSICTPCFGWGYQLKHVFGDWGVCILHINIFLFPFYTSSVVLKLHTKNQGLIFHTSILLTFANYPRIIFLFKYLQATKVILQTDQWNFTGSGAATSVLMRWEIYRKNYTKNCIKKSRKKLHKIQNGFNQKKYIYT